MKNRCIGLAAVFLALYLSACSTPAVSESKTAPAHAPGIVALFSPTSVTGDSIRDETIRRIEQTARTTVR